MKKNMGQVSWLDYMKEEQEKKEQKNCHKEINELQKKQKERDNQLLTPPTKSLWVQVEKLLLYTQKKKPGAEEHHPDTTSLLSKPKGNGPTSK